MELLGVSVARRAARTLNTTKIARSSSLNKVGDRVSRGLRFGYHAL